MAAISDQIVERLHRVLGQPTAQIPLHAPEFKGREWDYVKECLDTGWVSSVGSYVDRFERDLAAYTGSPHVVVTTNGTAALHVSLLLEGVQAGDEVLMPALTFIATANAISYIGAVPHFVDVEERTLGVDPATLKNYLAANAERRSGQCYNKKSGRRIKALVIMHTFGHATDVEGCQRVCRDFGLSLIEDAAEALGSRYEGRHLGTFAKIGALSFNGNKLVTTGGGGALLIQDEATAKKAKHLTTTAKVPHAWEFFHDMVGFNYRMPNLNAALGCAQLEQLPAWLEQKRNLAGEYQFAFEGFDGGRIFIEPKNAKSNYWLNALILNENARAHRDEILSKANAAKMMTRPIWRLMNELPMYRECPSMPLPVSVSLQDRIINLPSSPHLAEASR